MENVYRIYISHGLHEEVSKLNTGFYTIAETKRILNTTGARNCKLYAADQHGVLYDPYGHRGFCFGSYLNSVPPDLLAKICALIEDWRITKEPPETPETDPENR
jgi:hypothetical protein